MEADSNRKRMDMKGYEEILLEFMEGGRKRFVIPVYQRNYDWELENCKQLYDDLVRMIRNNLRSHFFGCIVSQSNPDGNINEILIIDGQQRLTTVSLLLLAIHDSIRDGVVIPQDDGLADTVYEDYLIVKRDPSRTKLKLKPIKSDENAFNGLFGISPDKVEDSTMTFNYNYFRNRISKGEVTVDELFRAVGQLQIINIGLGPDDSPQLIFESLNSKGMSLSQGDLIRNYILMDAPAQEQERLYDRFWNPIEANTGYDVTAFMRYYLGVKTRQSPIEEKLYSAFKRFVEERPVTKDSLLQEMLDYSRRYGILLRGGTKVPSVDGVIARLNRLDATVVRPFLLEVLRRCDDGELTWDDVARIMMITEGYIFRRNICELPTNKLKNIFLNMDKDVVRLDGGSDRYIDKFMFILLSKTDNSRFPDQIEFIDAFLNREVYRMNGRIKSYIFERLENQGTR
ncbi:MAG: DUF262 domain-containing protein, partial [Candidatus Methanomethylophilaceae archaeon]|nr:DUF262 domain-containing protein [Candidatus Methanomethylophilaceae archaeon]